MPNRKLSFAAAALAVALGSAGAITLPTLPAAAQQSAAPPAPSAPAAPQQQQQRPQRPPRASHIEGRIAYLKTELHITPAQEEQWEKVAQAMRQDSTERRQAFEQMQQERTAPPDALRRLETTARLSAMRSQQTERFLAVFRPLYDGLSDSQKTAANDLFGPHGHHFHHRG